MTEWPRTLEDALAAMQPGRHLQLEFSFNLLNPQQKLMYVRCTDPVFPRRKPVDLLPGPVVGESIPDMLRSLAGAHERAQEMAADVDHSEPAGPVGT